MCLALVITNLGMTLIQTRLKIPPPAPLSLSPLLPPRRCPIHCPPRSRPPFARPPVCAPPSFPRRQGVQQGEPAPVISTASPFTHPPFVQAASRPTGVATPFASPHSSCPPFPPPPFSRKWGSFVGSAHRVPVVRGHLPAWFLATALGTAPPRSPAPPACLALCALAEAQERQCATPPPLCLRAVLSARGVPHPLPVYAPDLPHTPSTPLRGRRGRSTDSAPTPSFPFADSPLRPGCATPHPPFTRPPPPTPPPPPCARRRGPARTARPPPPFPFTDNPSAQVAPPPTPGLRAPPRPHTRHAFARMPEAQGGQCTSPSFRAEGTAPTFRSRAVPPACPPVCAHARVAGGTARPPFCPRQSPPLGLRHPRLACAPSPCPRWCLHRHAVD